MEKKNILRELTKDVHMPSFCDEEGRCEALEDCTVIDANECSCCNINRIVNAFNRGIEFQKQKSPWISVEDDLPCNHEELIDKNFKARFQKTLFVIAWSANHYEDLTCMINENGRWEWIVQGAYTHWMPIPEPPKQTRD